MSVISAGYRCRSTCVRLLLALLAATGTAWAADPAPDPSAGLRNQYITLADQLHRSPWGQPLVVFSEEEPNRLKGDIYAVVPHDYAHVSRSLANPDNWCDVVMLHPNTKYCRATPGPSDSSMQVRIGTASAAKDGRRRARGPDLS